MSKTLKETQVFRFDQIAVQVRDKVDPAEADVDRYVGLEHIDPGSLKIRRWGETSDVQSSKIIFKSGDIIFGKRRAYQRKLAVADFDGICSAHAMVLRPKTDVVLEDFLPFFMQSDIFMDCAVKISVGGLSPTINWRDLAKEEFTLPPLDEQRRIAEVLRAAEAAKEAVRTLMNASLAARVAFAESFIRQNPPDTALDGVLDSAAYGTSERASDEERGLPVLRIPNVVRGAIILEDLKWIQMDDADEERYRVDDGDVLIVRTNGNPDYVGRCVVSRQLPRTFAYASYLIRLRTDPDRLVPEFLTAMLNSPTIRRTMRGSIRSSAGNYNLNSKGIRSQRIPLPGTGEQEAFLRTFARIGAGFEQTKKRVSELRKLQSSLLEEVGG